jgi:hypothetical protein
VIFLAEVTQWSTTAAQIAGGRGSFASGDGRAGHQPGRLFRANNGLVQRDMIGTVVPTPRSRPRPDPAPHARAIVAKAPNLLGKTLEHRLGPLGNDAAKKGSFNGH